MSTHRCLVNQAESLRTRLVNVSSLLVQNAEHDLCPGVAFLRTLFEHFHQTLLVRRVTPKGARERVFFLILARQANILTTTDQQLAAISTISDAAKTKVTRERMIIGVDNSLERMRNKLAIVISSPAQRRNLAFAWFSPTSPLLLENPEKVTSFKQVR